MPRLRRLGGKAGIACFIGALMLLSVAATRAWAGGDPAQSQKAPDTKPLKITFYPVLVRVPVFGATIDAPAIGGGGGESGDQSGKTDLSLNGAFMAGFSVETHRWFGEIQGLWAALSANHSLPHLKVDSDTYFFNARGGVRVAPGLFATVGLRRVTVGLNVELTTTKTADVIGGATKPGFWDPLLGVDWRGPMGRGWTFDAAFQGGGFGVGTDLDLNADFYADKHFGPHFLLRLGYTLVHLKTTIDKVQLGSFQRTLIASQTLHGPAFGFGIVF